LPQPRQVEIPAALPAKAPGIVPIHNQAKAAAALFTAFHPDASSGASRPHGINNTARTEIVPPCKATKAHKGCVQISETRRKSKKVIEKIE
jgi:hypothetical protein